MHAHFDLLDRSEKIIPPILDQLASLLKKHKNFHIIFLFLLSLEFAVLLVFFSFFIKSYLFGVGIAFFFVTFFSYLTLIPYQTLKKKEQLEHLLSKYAKGVESFSKKPSDSYENRYSVQNAYLKLAEICSLNNLLLVSVPRYLPNRVKIFLFEYFSSFFSQDIYIFKEIILHKVIEENIRLVKLDPLKKESHTKLAESYLYLAALYHMAKKDDLFKKAHMFAIEEFKIVDQLFPDHLPTLEQLAKSYEEAGLKEGELSIYEKIVEIAPSSPPHLLKLGELYFEKGLRAKGLQIYQVLKNLDLNKSDRLISCYEKCFIESDSCN